MEKDEVEYFLGKKVVINLLNNFKYTGCIKEARGDSMFFEDVMLGIILVSYRQIRLIRMYQEKDNPPGLDTSNVESAQNDR